MKVKPMTSDQPTRRFSPAPGTLPVDEAAIAHLASRTIRDEKTGCLVWQRAKSRTGYGIAHYGGRTRLAHRLSYEANCGPVPNGLHVLHVCDNRPCIAIEHLFLGTQQDNISDMHRKGRGRWPTPVLNAQLVGEMKRRFALGQSAGEVAKLFGKPYRSVYAVKIGHTWKKTPPATEPLITEP
jgi:hypothetical protein